MFKTIILILLVCSFTIIAQPAVEFIRSYGGQTQDRLYDIYAVSNGDYVMCGYKEVEQGESRYWMIRIDNNGDELWSNLYDGGIAFTIIETDAGNFLSAGADANGIKAILTDGEGDLIWSNNFGYGRCKAVIELKSGEFLLAGYIIIGNQNWGYLAMIDGDGDLLWERNYEPNRRGEFNAMRETDGGVVLAGMNNSFREGWLVKADIENDGEIIWSRHHNGNGLQEFRSITSVPGGGFVLTGLLQDVQRFGAPRTFYVMKVDDEGNQEWINFPHNERDHEWATTILSTGNTGFIAVGKQREGLGRDDGYLPAAFRTNSEGALRWQATYELDDLIMLPRCILNSAVIGEDGSIVAAGDVSWANENGFDGLVIKLELEILEPVIFRYSPEDTVFYVLIGDSVEFIARARDQQGDELSNLWIVSHEALGEDSLGGDTTITYTFEELGEYLVQCQVSDGEFTATVRWHVTSEEFYIEAFAPDSLLMTIQRDRELDFSLDVRMIEGLDPNYRWILTDRNLRQTDIGEENSVRHHFDLAGNFGLEGKVYHEGVEHSVHWRINVRSLLYWWTPHEREFTIPISQPLEFSVIPFEPMPDSMEFMWFINGIDEEIYDLGLFHTFRDTGVHTVTAIAYDGAEVDTVVWTVRVFHPDAVGGDPASLLPSEVTLYPAAPNPFNSTTSIRYFLPIAGEVRLSIYDSAGRLVQTLADGWQIADDQRASLNGADLAAGVYLLRLEAGGTVQTGKVVLLK